MDKWEAVRSLDPIAISQSLRAQAQKKPTEARTVPSGQEVSQHEPYLSSQADGSAKS